MTSPLLSAEVIHFSSSEAPPLSSSPPQCFPPIRSRRSSYVYLACDFCRSRKKKCNRPSLPLPSTPSPSSSSASSSSSSSPSPPSLSCSQCTSARIPCIQSSTQRHKRQKRSRSRPLVLSRLQDRVERAIAVCVVVPPPANGRAMNEGEVGMWGEGVEAVTESPLSPSMSRVDLSEFDSASGRRSTESLEGGIGGGEEDEPLPQECSMAMVGPSNVSPPPPPSPPPPSVLPLLPPHSISSLWSTTFSPITSSTSPLPDCSFSLSDSSLLSFPSFLSGRPASASPSTSPFPSLSHPTLSPSSPAFRLVSRSASYVSSYFSWINRGLYHFLDEQSFYQSYSSHHVHHTADTDNAWLCCVGSVMAIGARMHEDCAYSSDCAEVARSAVRQLFASSPPITNSTERLALAYRSVLVLAYYAAAMLESTTEWHSKAEILLSCDGVRERVPESVIRLAHLKPSFADAFARNTADTLMEHRRGGGSRGGERERRDDRMSGSLSEAVLYHQRTAYPLDRWKYLKIKRILRSQLSLDADDEELTEGAEWDDSVDVTSSLSSTNHEAEVNSVNYHVIQSFKTIHLSQPLPFSLYAALASLLMVEAEVLTDPVRGGILGMQAALYQLLGQRRLAVRVARDAIRPFCLPRYELPAPFLAPFALNTVRAIAILGEWDDSEGSEDLIAGGVRLVKRVGELWPALSEAAAELQFHLQGWAQEEVEREARKLEECRGRVEGWMGEGRGVMELLPSATAEFVERTEGVMRARNRKAVIDALSRKREAEVDGRRRGSEDEKLDGQWVIASLTALFSRASA